MKISKIKLVNFRCFQELEVPFETMPGAPANLTVLVAANGQGKTAVLEAVKYLLGIIISRLGVSSMKPKKSDLRQNWPANNQLFFFDDCEKSREKITAPYLRIIGEGVFEGKTIQWDTTLKRDNDVGNNRSIPPALGGKNILPFADGLLHNNSLGIPQILPIIAYFGTERAVIRGVPQRMRGFQKNFDTFEAYAGAMTGNLDYRKMIEWMVSLDYEQLKKRDKIKSYQFVSIEHQTIQLAIERMLPGFTNLRVEKEKRRAIGFEGGYTGRRHFQDLPHRFPVK